VVKVSAVKRVLISCTFILSLVNFIYFQKENGKMSDEWDSGLFIHQRAWHHKGKVVTKAVSMREALTMAEMDWLVEEYPLFSPNPDNLEEYVSVPGWKKLARSDNNATLHVCRESWTPVQNKDAFSWFDPFVESGQVELSAAVSLQEGKRIAITALIKDSVREVVKGDPVLPYLLLYNSHDGTLALSIKFTPIRVVCANTLKMASQGDHRRAKFSGGEDIAITKDLVRMRHTKNVNDNLTAVQDIINIQKRIFNSTVDEFKIMAATQIRSTDVFRQYLEVVFKDELKPVDGKKRPVETLESYNTLVNNFECGVGSDIPGVRGTTWNAYQAVTHWASHDRGRSSDPDRAARERLNALYFGQGAQYIAKAHDAALALAR
jgi:phage/plasmid-like protein (TIGR03299 family)